MVLLVEASIVVGSLDADFEGLLNFILGDTMLKNSLQSQADSQLPSLHILTHHLCLNT